MICMMFTAHGTNDQNNIRYCQGHVSKSFHYKCSCDTTNDSCHHKYLGRGINRL